MYVFCFILFCFVFSYQHISDTNYFLIDIFMELLYYF